MEKSMVYQSVDLLVDWWVASSDDYSVQQLGMRKAVRSVVRWVYPSVERKGNKLGHLMAEMSEHQKAAWKVEKWAVHLVEK